MHANENEKKKGIGCTKEAIYQWRALNERFCYLIDLRTTTARRHTTLVGLIGGFFLLALRGGSLLEGAPVGASITITKIDLYFLALAISSTMFVLGYCVMAYDWRIRARAHKVALEIERIAKEFSLLGDGKTLDHKKLDEDFWFFSQTFVINSFTLIASINSAILYCFYSFWGIEISITKWYFLLFDVILFITAWIVLKKRWEIGHKEYFKKVKNWAPT